MEQLDHPEWRGKPVIVGGDPKRHGVVSTCSYEARKYGVRSAMPSSTAARLCPDAIWTSGHFDRYKEMSAATMEVIRAETPLVEQVSIDEAFADVTPTRANKEHPISVAMRIQKGVAELGITCSIGLGSTKSVAKTASDMDKPSGLTVVFPGTEEAFFSEMPIRAISGIGKAAEAKLHSRGIKTLGEMAQADAAVLESVFGIRGEMMRLRAMGKDVSPVSTQREVKSVSHETTFSTDLTEREDIEAALIKLLVRVGRRLRMKGLKCVTLSLKLRLDDLSTHSAQTRLPEASDDDIALRVPLLAMIDKVWRPGQKVRLLGVGASGFDVLQDGQQSLFGDDGALFPSEGAQGADAATGRAASGVLIEDAAKRRNLIDAFDVLKDKFGEESILFGSELRNADNTTGSSSKNPTDYR